MNDTTKSRLIRGLSAALIAAALLASIAGCTKKAATPAQAPKGATAKESFVIAKSSLATEAPDAKLLVVQTRDVVTATSTPVWEYLIGSPKTDTVYAVIVDKGQANPQVYGKANLSAEEWSAVPAADQWKIDSPEAHDKALAAFPDGKPGTAYLMGFVTYVPKASTNQGAKPMIWNVSFDPSSVSKATTNTVDVNVTTGETTIPK